MLSFPRWKTTVVLVVTLFFVLLALPNILSPETRAKLPGIFPTNTIPLGLDLRGGSHLLLELDFNSYKRDHFINVRDGLRDAMRKAKVGYLDLRATGNEVTFRIRPETVTKGHRPRPALSLDRFRPDR